MPLGEQLDHNSVIIDKMPHIDMSVLHAHLNSMLVYDLWLPMDTKQI